ncbi:hypothetical protein DFH94DRAFT_366594 [Russula ochroleuca]|uniref:Uncharacterized protein n=1 Tax=Russula ochroleuca TaxID=152965 RepID=A0A9P5MZK4_9AGAM|nr:hypothetical protein DFH94DRAFT_366594 [Russula ochroleuca]
MAFAIRSQTSSSVSVTRPRAAQLPHPSLSLCFFEPRMPGFLRPFARRFPGPASIVRALLRTPMFVDAPLRLYAATCHFGWAEDVIYAPPDAQPIMTPCTAHHSSKALRAPSRTPHAVPRPHRGVPVPH